MFCSLTTRVRRARPPTTTPTAAAGTQSDCRPLSIRASGRPGRRIATVAALSVLAIAGMGTARAEAIQNGSDVPWQAYPEVAFVGLGNGGSCTGALVRPEWVLTAGHCVNALRPYFASVSIGGSTTATLRPKVVAGVRRHPAWPNAGGPDIALIRLAEPVTDVAPVGLAAPSDAPRFDGPADPVRAVGWGLLDDRSKGGQLATTLQTKTGTVNPAANGILDATFTNGGVCGGDSGGPLFIETPDRGRVVAGALARAGVLPADCGNVGAYTNVGSGTAARDWIDSVLNTDSGVSEATERPWTAGLAPGTSPKWQGSAGPAPGTAPRTCFSAGDRDADAEFRLPNGVLSYRTSWFVYDPGADPRRVHVTTDRSQVDTVVGVFESTGDTLQYDLTRLVAGNDDSGLTKQSSVVFTTQDNKPLEKVYLIGIGTRSPAETGQVCVDLIDTAPPTTTFAGDIAWHNSKSGETLIWYMNGRRVARRATVLDENGAVIRIGPPWRIVGTSDMNADRKADILWHNSQSGETQIWFMDGHKLARRATVLDENGRYIPIGPPWRIVGTSYMNGDPKADILWHNSKTGAIQIWYMDGHRISALARRATVLDENGRPISALDAHWHIVGTSDMNRDLRADIVWYNSKTGETQIWFMKGHKLDRRETVLDENGRKIFIGPPWKIVGAGDMNADRKADIVWHNSKTGETQIWFMNGHRISALARRATVLDESGRPIPIGPPWSIVGLGVFNPLG
jgi:hypothetical protein